MRLRYSKSALQQIDDALGYIAGRSPRGAAKVENRILTILALLQLQPHTGSRTRIPGVRRVFLTPYPYLVDYYVGADEIVIQRFRHAARRPVARRNWFTSQVDESASQGKDMVAAADL